MSSKTVGRMNHDQNIFNINKQEVCVCVCGGGSFGINKLPQISSESHFNITTK